MNQLPWWEAFKYGPVDPVTIELNRKTARATAAFLLYGFLHCSHVLFYGPVFLEKNSDIATVVGDLEGSIAGKHSIIRDPAFCEFPKVSEIPWTVLRRDRARTLSVLPQ